MRRFESLRLRGHGGLGVGGRSVLVLVVVVFLLSGCLPVSDLRRVSLDSVGGQLGSGGGGNVSVSDDGRFVVFASKSGELPGANGHLQVYRKDLTSGAVVVVSSTSLGDGGNADSSEPVISGDGSRVAFQSRASDFGVASSSAWNVYARDVDGSGVMGPIDLVSSSASGVPAAKNASAASISGDGSVISFVSSDTSLATVEPYSNGAVFVSHRGSAGVQAVSSAINAGVDPSWPLTWGQSANIFKNGITSGHSGKKFFDGVSTGHHALSADGRLVVYNASWAGLGALGSSVCHGSYQTEAVLVTDVTSGTTITLAYCRVAALRGANGGSAGTNGVVQAAIAPDGSWVGIPLVGGIALMSPNQSQIGYLPAPSPGALIGGSGLAVANGGKLVSIQSTEPFSADDLNGKNDQYLVGGSMVTRASVLPPPDSNGVVSASTISADGARAVFASSASNLVAGDTNGSTDVFAVDVAPALMGDASAQAIGDVTGLFPILAPETRGGCNPLEPTMANATGVCADPVNTWTGNFTEAFTDVAVPGRGGGLGVTRTYNSKAASAVGMFGAGWVSNLDISAVTDSSSGNVTIRLGGGAEVLFKRYVVGTFVGPVRVKASLSQNATGLLLTLDSGDKWQFNAVGRLLSQTDPNGHATTYSYDSNGLLVAVSDRAGHSLTLDWSGGHVVKATDPVGRQVSYSYSGDDLVGVVDLAGGSWEFGYDSGHLLTSVTTPEQVASSSYASTVNVYDGQGRVTQQTDAEGHSTTFDYSSVPNSTVITGPDGVSNLDTYINGVRTAHVDGYGTSVARTTTYSYDGATLQPTAVTDSTSHVQLTLGYNDRGQIISSTDALGHTSSFTYTRPYRAPSRLSTVTDPNGLVATLTYDAYGNVTKVSQPYAEKSTTKSVTYQISTAAATRGDVLAVTNPNGHKWTYTYDANGLRISGKDPLGHTSTVGYDDAGRITSATSARGYDSGATPADYTTTYTTDAFGAVTGVVSPLGESVSFSYDADGNLTSSVDPKHQTTTFTYNALGQPTGTHYPDGTDSSVSYDTAGRAYQTTDRAGRHTTIGYDSAGRPSTITDTAGRTSTAIYDAEWRVARTQAPGGNCAAVPATGCTTRSYDTAGNVTGVDYSDDTSDVTYSYDTRGALSGYSDGTGTTSYTRDSIGKITSSTDGAGNTVGYAYDRAGNLTGVTYPGAHTVTKAYNAAEQLTSVTDWNNRKWSYTYDSDGHQTKLAYPGNVNADTFAHDRDGQLTGIDYQKSSTSLAALAYTHDPNQLVDSITQTSLPGADGTYGYDELDQLTSDEVGTYSYDHADNLTGLPDGTRQHYDAKNQICFTAPTGVSGGTCTAPPTGADTYYYDGYGNRVGHLWANGNAALQPFNLAGQMTAYLNNYTQNVSYTYNAQGLRQSVTTDGASGDTTSFVWDQVSQVPQLLTQTDQAGMTSFIYGNGTTPIGQINPDGSTELLHGDHIGSIRVTTDTTGTVTSKRTWDPYGNLTNTTGTPNTPFGYAGSYHDPISGYDYLQARYYDPATGQFISPDPIGTIGGSGYSYIANSPLNGTDPLGLSPGDPYCVNNPSQLDGGCNGTIPTRPSTGQTIANHAGGILNTLTFNQLADDPLFDRVDECSTAYKTGQITGMVILALAPIGRTGGITRTETGIDGIAATIRNTPRAADDFVDLASSSRRTHILQGDATGGGHLWPGAAGKTPFPQSWSGNRIMHEISDIATDPAAWRNAVPQGSRTVLTGTRGGVDIRVVVDSRTGEIISGYPTNLPRNP